MFLFILKLFNLFRCVLFFIVIFGCCAYTFTFRCDELFSVNSVIKSFISYLVSVFQLTIQEKAKFKKKSFWTSCDV